MRPPLWLRLFASSTRPLSHIAAQLNRLNRNLEHYFAATGIPLPASTAEVEAHRDEPAVPPYREEWEIALDEEMQKRAEAVSRETLP